MIDLENPHKQGEWLGTKPDSYTRMIITVATVTSIIVLSTFVLLQNFVGFSGASGGLFIGILGGLLTSGLLASISWAVYDQFLPAYLHRKFQPKIGGKWFGYYHEEGDDGSRWLVREYIYINQIANKVSGTIIEKNQQEVYLFNGEIAPTTLILNWKPQNETRNILGAIVLTQRGDTRWEGIQVFGSQSKLKPVNYYMLKYPLQEEPQVSTNDPHTDQESDDDQHAQNNRKVNEPQQDVAS